MDRGRIIAEIKRTAEENGGVPLGYRSFTVVTGIGMSKWRGKHWRSWSDALLEAGFTPNPTREPHDREVLIVALAALTKRLGHFPTQADLALEKRANPTFPTASSFDKHIGLRPAMIEAVRQHAAKHPEFAVVLAVLPEASAQANQEEAEGRTEVDGAVYMLRLGKHYKVGKSFRVPQRHREIAIELPQKPDVIHVIATDDPTGIEQYWHKRFADKQTNGEWFALNASDVRAFKRRKFM